MGCNPLSTGWLGFGTDCWRSNSPCLFVPSVLIHSSKVQTVQCRDNKEKTSLTAILTFLATVNKEFAELYSPAFVLWECTRFTAGITLVQHSRADSAGPTIILSCSSANWLLQGSDLKNTKEKCAEQPFPPCAPIQCALANLPQSHPGARWCSAPSLTGFRRSSVWAAVALGFIGAFSSSQVADFSADCNSSHVPFCPASLYRLHRILVVWQE